MKVTRKQLRQLIKEEIGRSQDKPGQGLPNANELSRKLSAVDPGEALAFIARVLSNMRASSAPAAPETPPPAPPAPEEDEQA